MWTRSIYEICAALNSQYNENSNRIIGYQIRQTFASNNHRYRKKTLNCSRTFADLSELIIARLQSIADIAVRRPVLVSIGRIMQLNYITSSKRDVSRFIFQCADRAHAEQYWILYEELWKSMDEEEKLNSFTNSSILSAYLRSIAFRRQSVSPNGTKELYVLMIFLLFFFSYSWRMFCTFQ